MNPTIEKHADVDALTTAAADRFVACANAAAQARGIFHVALSGGSTPRPLFQKLATTHREKIPWAQVRLWWGDERCVAPDHADSNYRMAREAMLEALALPAMQICRMVGEAPNREAEAVRYAAELARALPVEDGVPVFDLMLQGMGGDGHTASLFPTTGKALVRDRAVVHVVPPAYVKPQVDRISVTAPVIQAAREVHVLVAGADKADMVQQVIQGPVELDVHPITLLRAARGEVRWLLDRAAAAKLS